MKLYALRRYQRTLVDTADRRATIIYLYDAAIRACRQAAEAIEEGRVNDKCRHLDRALMGVVELAGALDFEIGGALAIRLVALYAYLIRSLVESNADNDAGKALGCLSVLRTLRDGWEQVANMRNPLNEAGAAPSYLMA
ncbi:MAG: flagellar export chaperone FliS [Candidatus Sumerlaeota bacterium]|nr:flagellar export chaperone FliS [Candidatus Sumerlaeota bacterium]